MGRTFGPSGPAPGGPGETLFLKKRRDDMNTHEDFYRARAAEAQAEAAAAPLANVRERCLRAAAAWEAMADRAHRTDQRRTEQEARKAAMLAA